MTLQPKNSLVSRPGCFLVEASWRGPTPVHRELRARFGRPLG
jgi:hypothetical protein